MSYSSVLTNVPGLQDIIFGYNAVTTAMESARYEIKNHFLQNSNSVEHTGYRNRLDVSSDPNRSWLSWGLGRGTLGFKATRQGNEVTIKWFYYDEVDFNSYAEHKAAWEESASPPSSGEIYAAYVENGFDLLFDKIGQNWFYIRVSQYETFNLH